MSKLKVEITNFKKARDRLAKNLTVSKFSYLEANQAIEKEKQTRIQSEK